MDLKSSPLELHLHLLEIWFTRLGVDLTCSRYFSARYWFKLTSCLVAFVSEFGCCIFDMYSAALADYMSQIFFWIVSGVL